MWRINGTENVSIFSLKPSERERLFKKWRENGAYIECLCQKNENGYPRLHIRMNHLGNCFPANNPGNRKYRLEHEKSCPFSPVNIHNYDSNANNSVTQPKEEQKKKIELLYPDLKEHFLNILEIYRVLVYNPKEKRQIEKRLFRGILEYEPMQHFLQNKSFYISHNEYKYLWKKHHFIVGWIKRSELKEKSFFFEVPIYALNNLDHVCHIHRIPSFLMDEIKEWSEDSAGYILIYRTNDNKWKEKQVHFIPAEPQSLIPYNTFGEYLMIKYLVSQKHPFRKIQREIHLKEQKIVIEIVNKYRAKKPTREQLEKMNYYKEKGISYLIWDESLSIPNVINNV